MKITPIAAAVILPAVAAGAAFGAVPLARAAPAAPAAAASPAAHAAAQHAARVTAKRPAPSAVHHYRHHAQHKAAVVAGHSQAATSATAGSQSAASSAQAQQPAAVSGGSLTGGMSSFEQCVAWRESGDTPTDPDGLFGILPSTWAQLGYSGTAGQASVGQQEVAFQRLYAEYGAQPWAPSDGC